MTTKKKDNRLDYILRVIVMLIVVSILLTLIPYFIAAVTKNPI